MTPWQAFYTNFIVAFVLAFSLVTAVGVIAWVLTKLEGKSK